jgi:multiple sugar transport system substrate-binding protein
MSQHSAFSRVGQRTTLTRRSLIAGSLGTASAMLLAACSSGTPASTAKVTTGPAKLTQAQLAISWWGADDRTTKTLAALKLYTQKHPQVTFQSSYGGIVGYQDKMVTQFSGGNGPDLMQISDRLPFIANNQLLDLDPYIKAGRINLSDANQATLDAQRVNGKLYTIPWGLSANCFFYNKALFSSADVPEPKNGWTWDDYVDTLEKLKAGLPDGAFASEDVWAPAGTMSWQPFQLHLMSLGIKPYKDDGKAFNFSTAELSDWLSFWQGLLKKDYLPSASVTASENAIQTSPFVKRQAALYPINSSIASSLQALMKDELGVVTFPTGYQSKKYLPATEFGEYINAPIIIGANAKSQAPDDVVDVINFLLTDPDSNKLTLMSRGVPLVSSAAKLVTPLVTPIEQAMTEMVNYVQAHATKNTQAFPSVDGQIGTLMQNTAQSVAFGKQSVSAAASDFFSQAKTILASQA